MTICCDNRTGKPVHSGGVHATLYRRKETGDCLDADELLAVSGADADDLKKGNVAPGDALLTLRESCKNYPRRRMQEVISSAAGRLMPEIEGLAAREKELRKLGVVLKAGSVEVAQGRMGDICLPVVACSLAVETVLQLGCQGILKSPSPAEIFREFHEHDDNGKRVVVAFHETLDDANAFATKMRRAFGQWTQTLDATACKLNREQSRLWDVIGRKSDMVRCVETLSPERLDRIFYDTEMDCRRASLSQIAEILEMNGEGSEVPVAPAMKPRGAMWQRNIAAKLKTGMMRFCHAQRHGFPLS